MIRESVEKDSKVNSFLSSTDVLVKSNTEEKVKKGPKPKRKKGLFGLIPLRTFPVVQHTFELHVHDLKKLKRFHSELMANFASIDAFATCSGNVFFYERGII